MDDLVVAGSHGFDIWSPGRRHGPARRGRGRSRTCIREVTGRLREEVGSVEGALVEPKRSSVAVHYRLVAEAERPRIKAIVDARAGRASRTSSR